VFPELRTPSADRIPRAFIVRDANGQVLTYVYSRTSEAETSHFDFGWGPAEQCGS
jgi:hypothetical protein